MLEDAKELFNASLDGQSIFARATGSTRRGSQWQ
jgi:hypothetical protein